MPPDTGPLGSTSTSPEPGSRFDSGGVRMLADGNLVRGIEDHGHHVRQRHGEVEPAGFINSWGTYRLTVRYGGADKDVAAGIGSLHFRVRVR